MSARQGQLPPSSLSGEFAIPRNTSSFTYISPIPTAHNGRTHGSAPTAFGKMLQERGIFGRPGACGRNGQGLSLRILLRSLIKSHRDISRQICSKFTVGFLYPNHAETHLLKILGNSSKYRAEKGRKQTYNRLHLDRKSTRLNSSHNRESRMPSSA